LRCIGHDLNHRSANLGGIRRHAGIERLDKVLDFPIFQFALRDVRHTTLPGWTLPPRTSPASDHSAKQITRRVTFAAVTCATHQIGAAIPWRRLCWIEGESLAVEEQELPNSENSANIKRKRQGVVAYLAGNRRQGFQVGEQIT